MHYDMAFLGFGSIAKRHLKNVCDYLTSRGDTYSIDLYRSSLNNPIPAELREFISKSYLYADGPQKCYDVVFITNPTAIHYDSICKFKNNTKSFFIEKPIFDKIDINDSLLDEIKNVISYVACPLRYHPVLQYVFKYINYKDALAVRAISSSYLPDWRPNQDYRQCYSAHRDMGGGVGIDLIHEWDYLFSLFGMPDKVFSIQDKISQLEIDSDDIAIYIAKCTGKTIELHLDYFGRKTMRTLTLFMPDETIFCDMANGRIDFLTKEESIDLNADRNLFQLAEIIHFFDIVDGKISSDSTPEDAFKILKLTKGII